MTPRTITIHQPEYFPWLGFLDKARLADTLVLLDNVQFDRSSLQNRARVLGSQGASWLTIPFVHKFPQTINDVKVADQKWKKRHFGTLQACYGRAAGFKDASPKLQEFYQRQVVGLCDATVASVQLLLAVAGLEREVLLASQLNAQGEKAELVLNICKSLGATRYVSGRSGASYLEPEPFDEAGIELVIQNYTLPYYSQLHATPPDVGGVSALDAWLNLGADGLRDLLQEGSS